MNTLVPYYSARYKTNPNLNYDKVFFFQPLFYLERSWTLWKQPLENNSLMKSPVSSTRALTPWPCCQGKYKDRNLLRCTSSLLCMTVSRSRESEPLGASNTWHKLIQLSAGNTNISIWESCTCCCRVPS